MRMERLANLLSVRRLSSCLALLRAPVTSHIRLAGLGKGPIVLEDRAGRRLTCPSYRTVRGMWRFLLEEREARDVAFDDGVVTFTYDGARLALRPDNSDFGVFEEVWRNDTYGLARLEGADTVVDLGGNIGLFSARAAARARRVIMVEPVPANLAIARRNLEGAGVACRVVVVPGVVTDASGQKVTLHVSGIAGMHSVSHAVASAYSEASASVEVESLSLDDLFARDGVERCDLLKVDIEGAEFSVFRGASDDTLRRVQRVVMEVHLTPDDGPRATELFARLERAGLPPRVVEGSATAPSSGLSTCIVRASRTGGD